MIMTYSQQVQNMCPITKGPKHGPAPIPEEGAWVKAYEIKDISGYTHGVGWCAPQQGTCKLSLNIKNGVIEEALVETIGCSGMTHSAAMAGEILPGKTILEALNTDLVCDAINVAMRELFLQIVYGRSQTAFSEDGLPIGAGLDDLGKGLRSMTGTIFSTKAKGVRYLELTEGYINKLAVDANDEVIGYQFVKLGKMMEDIRHGKTPNEAYEKNVGTYGRFSKEAGAVRCLVHLLREGQQVHNLIPNGNGGSGGSGVYIRQVGHAVIVVVNIIQLCNMDDLILNQNTGTVYFADPELQLDVGSIGKGYAVEQCAQAAEARGLTSALLNVGGNVRAIGTKPNSGPWVAGVDNPWPDQDGQYATASYVDTVELQPGQSLVISGDYQRYFTVDGVRYHHLIDLTTLQPARYMNSVAIVSSDSGLGDALSTGVFCMPVEKGQALIEQLNDVEALWMLSDETMVQSSGWGK